ncbi:hypothetical protein HOLleu_35479 [Holothuria leucospilota]|uniref:Uncharacterized protein n=1 Tax=Holothuria leucospilota TaxID=206669 RepID=A0A9Q0YT52_HOLLE|nr:hypothetical protein HOLleu_35479 [Holothuria leucospilota]
MVYFVHYRPIYQRLWHSQLNPSAWRYIPNSLPHSSVSWHTSSQNLSFFFTPKYLFIDIKIKKKQNISLCQVCNTNILHT